MNQIVIVVNGSGGAGKDTLCGLAAKQYRVRNVSSVTPIKKIALENGWDGGKDPRSRKFLSDLKQLFTDFNDLPLQYLLQQYKEFRSGEEQIMFAHIREGTEIDKFRAVVREVPCVTLLIQKGFGENVIWGNSSDDLVEDYRYNYYYKNEKPLEEAGADFTLFLAAIIEEQYRNRQ